MAENTTRYSQDPITLLQQMEMEVLQREQARMQKSGSDESGLWYGIGYLINGVHFVSPLKHVREVLLHSKVVAVPETRHWLKGLAVSRGHLITVVDVAAFLEWDAAREADAGRWMLINDTRLNCAVVVQEVMGLKQFRESQALAGEEAPTPPAPQVAPFLTGKVFREDQRDWFELDLMKLSRDKQFVNAAIPA